MKTLNRMLPSYATAAAAVLCGILFLLWPGLWITIANTGVALILLVLGIAAIFRYFRETVQEGFRSRSLALGLTAVFTGLILLIKNDLLPDLLPFLLGLCLMVGGFFKVQMAVDLRRMDSPRWQALLAAALISLVLGMLGVFRPAFVTGVLVQFMGVSLIAEGLMDAAGLFITGRGVKAYARPAAKAEKSEEA